MGMTSEDQVKYRQLFLQTAREYKDDLDKNLALLREDLQNKQAINQIHIDAHSIKGQALMMTFPSLAYYCAAVEKIFLDKQENTIEITQEIIVTLQNDLKILNNSLSKIEQGEKEIDMTENIRKLEDYIKTNKKIL